MTTSAQQALNKRIKEFLESKGGRYKGLSEDLRLHQQRRSIYDGTDAQWQAELKRLQDEKKAYLDEIEERLGNDNFTQHLRAGQNADFDNLVNDVNIRKAEKELNHKIKMDFLQDEVSELAKEEFNRLKVSPGFVPEQLEGDVKESTEALFPSMPDLVKGNFDFAPVKGLDNAKSQAVQQGATAPGNAATAGALAATGGYIGAAANLLGAFTKDKEEYKFDPGVLEQAGAKTAGANALAAGASQVARAGNINLANTQNRMAQQVANQNNGASGLSAAMALAEGMSADNSNAQNMAQAAQMQSQAQEQQASGQQFLNQNVRVVKKKELFGSEGLADLVEGAKGLTGGALKGAADMRGFWNNTLDSKADKMGLKDSSRNSNTGEMSGLLGTIKNTLSPAVEAASLGRSSFVDHTKNVAEDIVENTGMSRSGLSGKIADAGIRSAGRITTEQAGRALANYARGRKFSF